MMLLRWSPLPFSRCSPFALSFATLIIVAAPFPQIALAVEPAIEKVDAFLQNHCLDCHDGASGEGGLDLAGLPRNLDDAAHFAAWVRVFDRVEAGEMPPADYEELAQATREGFLDISGQWLREVQTAKFHSEGRVRGRRLTNQQLERTLHDLLGIDIPLVTHIPEEPRNGHYSTLADAQSLSHFQLESIVKVIDLALDEAIRRSVDGDRLWTREMIAKQISRTRPRCREPEYIDEAAVVWSSKLIFYGRIPATTAKQDGWYRFRISASALKRPQDHGVWSTIRTGPCVSSAPLMNWVGSFEAGDEAKEIEFETWLPKGHMLEIRPGDSTLKMARFAGGQSANGEGGKQDVPGISIHWLTMERFHKQASDEEIRQRLFGSLTPSELASSKEASDSLRTTCDQLLAEFATRAWRRPVQPEQLELFQQIFEQTLEDTGEPIKALRAGYRAILCSARFLYFYETPGKLDDFALASRLSYALWNSMPDERLFDLATAGKLTDADVLATEIERMLADEKGRQFIEDFADQWLQLDQIDATEPDRRMYANFDLIVQNAMLAETRQFLLEMLRENRPIADLVASDFTYLNSRLARYYELPEVPSDAVVRTGLTPASHRGGLLGQGAILKVTANGTNTSPVLRGVWVSERLLGIDIPPPPTSVPAIEPDIRGATTIRQQLAQHRDNPECASCHRKIDPAGFALENFDATGRWRDNYPKVVGRRIQKGPPIDPSYQLEDGTPFDSFDQFRRLQSERAGKIARSFVENLLTYATGAEIQFADRPLIAKSVASTESQDYGFRSLVVAALTSEVFRNK